MAWLLFLVPIIAFGLGFGTARLGTARARMAAMAALIILPVTALITAIILGMPPGQLGRELSIGTGLLFFGLPALAWGAIVLLGHDLGRRTSSRHR